MGCPGSGACWVHSAAGFWLLDPSGPSSAEFVLACSEWCLEPGQSALSFNQVCSGLLAKRPDAIPTRAEALQNSMVGRCARAGLPWASGGGACFAGFVGLTSQRDAVPAECRGWDFRSQVRQPVSGLCCLLRLVYTERWWREWHQPAEGSSCLPLSGEPSQKSE